MLISVIVPCFNEEEVIRESYLRLTAVMTSLPQEHTYELLFINDGSQDRTAELLREITAQDTRTKAIFFSRNFGHQNAVSAGIHLCRGEVAIIIDADLQDPPEVMLEMLRVYQQEGCNVVYGVRKERKGETFLKKAMARLFYRLLNYLSDVSFPVDTGDFRLIDAKVINAYRQFPERNKYIRGLISWMGFKQLPVYYSRDARFAGNTKYSFNKMMSLALTGIFSFSKKPLKLAINIGLFSIFLGAVLTAWVFLLYFFERERLIPGWASTIITIIFMGGIQLFSVGILGEYLGNIFDETKGRPEYLIAEEINFDR
jgi:glycosyltransferase involved in cell wall biosynthesis